MKRPHLKRSRVILICLGIIALASCLHQPSEKALEGKPQHHTSQGFRNVHIEDPNKSFFGFLRLRLFGDERWADHEKTADLVPYQKLDLSAVQDPPFDQKQISWLGHSTFLIQYRGVNVLTDPIFSNRASPFGWAGPKRYTQHVVDYTLLPEIDFVVISHNHYDHLDETAVKTLLKISPATRYYVPLGLKAWFVSEGVDASYIQEMDWWDEAKGPISENPVSIRALPSQHWSARGLFDRRQTLWASWRIEIADASIWFAGDTGYNPVGFKEIGERMGPVELALIPIGAYDPRSFMQTYHVDPDEAVMIHRDVQATRSFGMHWGTYPLTAEEPMDPPARLAAARAREGLRDQDFQALSLGQTVILDIE